VSEAENPLHATMVHDLYATQVLLNRAEPASFNAAFHRSTGGEIDLAVARLQWANGTVASFSASYLTPAGMPPRGFDQMEVFGEGWAARNLPNPRPIEVWSEDRADWPMALEIQAGKGIATGMMAEEIRCFLPSCAKAGGGPDGSNVQRRHSGSGVDGSPGGKRDLKA
jgi:predicted dehydrogenase